MKMNRDLKGSQRGMTERPESEVGPWKRAASVGGAVCVRATVGAWRRRGRRAGRWPGFTLEIPKC